MFLNSKERIVDNVFTKQGRFFLFRGGDPSSFSPRSLASPYFDKENFSLGADSAYFAELLTSKDTPVGINTDGGLITQVKKTWARVVEYKSGSTTQTLPDFSKGWKPLTDFEDYRAGFQDLVRSVSSGSYDSGNSDWKLGSLVSVSGSEIQLNRSGRELKKTWQTFNDLEVKQASTIVKPDILAQKEFSNFINGKRLPPVVQDTDGQLRSLKLQDENYFQTNRTTSRAIRNRLVENDVESFEVDVRAEGLSAGNFLESYWIPVERQRFDYKYEDQTYVIETARALDVVKFDKNLYFVGKIVPVAMKDRPEITTEAFLRIFTLVFEDGT